MTGVPGIVFTAFEPSGDALAAPVIAQLRRLRPDLPIWALGGPRMAAAGATIIESTTEHAVMLAGAVSQAFSHGRRVRRFKRWLMEHPIAAHVPVDSPAANWSICKQVRRRQRQAKIIHLAAPQLWAWAPWRIRKLRRLTDHVLCLLPFEPDWFASRRVPASFVGHPVFEPSIDGGANAAPSDMAATPSDDATAAGLTLALLPGSRASEIHANWPMMLNVYRAITDRLPTVRARIAAANDRMAQLIRRQMTDDESAALPMCVGDAGSVLGACDAALVVSGTATLLTAAHRKPMVVVYNTSRWMWSLFGWWLIRTRTFSLPNLIAESAGDPRPVDEFVPHFGRVEPVVTALCDLLTSADARQRQHDALARISARFAGIHYASAATTKILDLI